MNINRLHLWGCARRTARSHGALRWGAAVTVAAAACLLPYARLEAQGPPPGAGRPVVLEGELDVLYEDGASTGRLLYFLRADGRRVPLRFQGAGPDLPTGSRVRVGGNLADDGTVSASSVSTLSVSATRTLGEQPVLVILFNFSDNTAQPYARVAAESVNAQVREFFLENSYRQTIMSFTVTGWHTIQASSSGVCDYQGWATLADAAATAAGFNVAAYARRVYAFPATSTCAWWGMGNLGGPRSWINGTYTARVVAHEQGHNFGDRHSHARKCDASGCVNVDYGDDRDVLGAGGVVGHLNAFQKERLGWLNYGVSPVIQTVTASNDYWIDNYETLRGNVKGLKISKGTDGSYYYLEARERVGFDASVAAGVTLHTGLTTDSDSSYQIDLDPLGTAWDSTLDAGQAVRDAARGVTFTTISSNIDGALVRVTFDPAACATAPPAVSLSPSAQTGTAGATLTYTVTVTNKNSSGCAASPFSFSAAPPSGWSASFNPASAASVAPGASTTTTLSLTSPAGAAGSYTFTLSTIDGTTGQSASASGSASIAGSLAVTASAAASKNSATITVVVKSGSTAVSGAAVTVTITSPAGGTTKLSATTGANGTATVRHSIKPRDPSGAYAVLAAASSGGLSGTATTSFNVP